LNGRSSRLSKASSCRPETKWRAARRACSVNLLQRRSLMHGDVIGLVAPNLELRLFLARVARIALYSVSRVWISIIRPIHSQPQNSSEHGRDFKVLAMDDALTLKLGSKFHKPASRESLAKGAKSLAVIKNSSKALTPPAANSPTVALIEQPSTEWRYMHYVARRIRFVDDTFVWYRDDLHYRAGGGGPLCC